MSGFDRTGKPDHAGVAPLIISAINKAGSISTAEKTGRNTDNGTDNRMDNGTGI
jgi:hypothetical protein